MNDLILFDIDNTLLDLHKIHNGYLIKWLNPKLVVNNLLALCFVSFGTDISDKRLDASYLNKSVFSKSIIPDAEMVLKSLSQKYSLGIFSQGFEIIQELKIVNSGLHKYFNEKYIFISKHKLTQVSRIHEKVGVKKIIFVDDRPDIANQLSESGFKVFLVNKTKKNNLSKNVTQFKNLKAVLAYLSN